MRSTVYILIAIAMTAAYADAPRLVFTDVEPTNAKLFESREVGSATYTHIAKPFLEWRQKHSGAQFPMDVAPVVTGRATGNIQQEKPTQHDVEPYMKKDERLARFVALVNVRNKGGRSEGKKSEEEARNPNKKSTLEDVQKNRYVVQSMMSTVIDVPFSRLNLHPDRFMKIPSKIDMYHFHHEIPGSLVIDALEKDHSAATTIRPEKPYILSIVDFGVYNCDKLESHLGTYAKLSGEPLANDSVYMISRIEMLTDPAPAEKLFGKRPNAVIVQDVFYTDRILKGGKNIFAFFAEGPRSEKTRIVSITNLGLNAKIFTSNTVSPIAVPVIFLGINGATQVDGVRGYVNLAGITAGGTAAAAAATVTHAGRTAVDKAGNVIAWATGGEKKERVDVQKEIDKQLGKKSAVANLIKKAKEKSVENNSCDRGLGQGLTAYSKVLFTEFVSYIQQPN